MVTNRPRSLTPLLVLCFLTSAVAFAKPQFYDPDTLVYWQTRYARSTNRILTDVLAPTLRNDEYETLQDLHLAFPLHSDTLLEFKTQNPPTITLPVASLKFMDDLCIASAWLSSKGQSLQAVEDYLAMVHYKNRADFPGGGYPAPLEAFDISAIEANDPAVNQQSLRCFNAVRAFVLGKGLGYRYYREKGHSSPNETMSDAFAIELLSRLHVVPLGLDVFFLAQAVLSPKEWEKAEVTSVISPQSAPLKATRVRGIIDAITKRRPAFAASPDLDDRGAMETLLQRLQQVERYLNDTDEQRRVATKAVRTKPSTLARQP